MERGLYPPVDVTLTLLSSANIAGDPGSPLPAVGTNGLDWGPELGPGEAVNGHCLLMSTWLKSAARGMRNDASARGRERPP